MSNTHINARGAWDASESYITLDAVTYNDYMWLATQASTGETPADGSSYWMNIGTTWTDAGRVCMIPKGIYDSTVTYEFLDTVLYNNASYVAKQTSVGQTPALNSQYWQMLTVNSAANVFTGATASEDGTEGAVPQPLAGEQNKVLFGNGDWGDLISTIRDAFYPVGTIKMTTENVNPGTQIGGTWVAWGSGRVPVGVSSDTEFNSVEKTGGEKTHTLTGAESGIPAHSHGLNSHTHGFTTGNMSANSTHNHKVGFGVDNTGVDTNIWANTSGSWTHCVGNPDSGCTYGRNPNSISGAGFVSTTNIQHTHSGTTNAATGNTANNTATNATNAHNNLQPYITCYMWKRTA